MTDFSALAYLDSRIALNTLRKIARQPGRAILYVLAIVYVAFFGFLRTRSRILSSPHPGLGEPFETFIFCGALLAVAIGIYAAASGFVGAFGSFADARFLIGSQLRERNVILWLQARHVIRYAGRLIFFVFLYAIIFRGVGTFGGISVALLGVVLVVAASGIPTLQLQRRFGVTAGYAAASAVALGAIVPAALAALSPAKPFALGRIASEMLAGSAPPLIALYALAALVGALVYLGSADLYPELYRASARATAYVARRSAGGLFAGRQRYDAHAAVRASGVESGAQTRLAGAWTLLWKDWIAFARGTASRRGFLLAVAVALAAGIIFGIYVRRSGDVAAALAGVGGSFGWALVIFVSFTSSVSLAADLRKPIWWLCADPLRTRLYVWTFATSWRSFVVVAIALVALGAAARFAPLFVWGLPAAFVLMLFLRAIGLGIYAIFPSALDRRGPVAMLRVLITVLALVPPALIWVAVALLTHTVVAGAAAAALVALLETSGIVEFASARISRNGVAIAQAES